MAAERSVPSGSQPPGSMAPVMSLLAAEQQDTMLLTRNDLKDEWKRFDKVQDLGNMGTMHPDEPGVDLRVLEDVTILLEY